MPAGAAGAGGNLGMKTYLIPWRGLKCPAELEADTIVVVQSVDLMVYELRAASVYWPGVVAWCRKLDIV